MVLVVDRDVHKRIVRIYSSLNLANMKIQKLNFVRNTAPDNQRVFMWTPDCRIFLLTYPPPIQVMSREWARIQQTIDLAPCCPKGADCGYVRQRFLELHSLVHLI